MEYFEMKHNMYVLYNSFYFSSELSDPFEKIANKTYPKYGVAWKHRMQKTGE